MSTRSLKRYRYVPHDPPENPHAMTDWSSGCVGILCRLPAALSEFVFIDERGCHGRRRRSTKRTSSLSIPNPPEQFSKRLNLNPLAAPNLPTTTALNPTANPPDTHPNTALPPSLVEETASNSMGEDVCGREGIGAGGEARDGGDAV